jgi:hypothetical protein
MGEELLRKLVADTVSEGKKMSAGTSKPQNQVIFPAENTPYDAKFDLAWRSAEKNFEYSEKDLANILIVAGFFYVMASNKRKVMYSVCVHEVRAGLSDTRMKAAKAGTGISLMGRIDRWNVGWSAA